MPQNGQFLEPNIFKIGINRPFKDYIIDRGLKIMSLQYQDKKLSCYKLKFHLGQKYAIYEISHNLLKGDMTTSIVFTDDNNKVINTHTKNECLKTQGS